MLVQPVVIPGSGTLLWTVLGDDDVPVVPVDRFLAYLTDIGRSPKTVKAYVTISRISGSALPAGAWTGGRGQWVRPWLLRHRHHQQSSLRAM